MNPFMDPPRYMPPGGEAAQVDLSLRTNEVAEVTDLGGTWHQVRAVLDTGARTQFDCAFPAQHTLMTRNPCSYLLCLWLAALPRHALHNWTDPT